MRPKRSPLERDGFMDALDSVLTGAGFLVARGDDPRELIALDSKTSRRFFFWLSGYILRARAVSKSGRSMVLAWSLTGDPLAMTLTYIISDIVRYDHASIEDALAVSKPPIVAVNGQELPAGSLDSFELSKDPQEASQRGRWLISVTRDRVFSLANNDRLSGLKSVLSQDFVTDPGDLRNVWNQDGALDYDPARVVNFLLQKEWGGVRPTKNFSSMLTWDRGTAGPSLRIGFPFSTACSVQIQAPGKRGDLSWFSVWSEPTVASGYEHFLAEIIKNYLDNFEPPSWESCQLAWSDTSSWVNDEKLWPKFTRMIWDSLVGSPYVAGGYAAHSNGRWMLCYDIRGAGRGHSSPDVGTEHYIQYMLERDTDTGGAAFFPLPVHQKPKALSWDLDQADFFHVFHPITPLSEAVKCCRETIRSSS